MESWFFKDVISKKMGQIKNKYSLIESFHKETAKYHHKDFTMMISLENYFEVSVCFVFNIQKNRRIYLSPLLQYFNVPSEVIMVAHRNQHSEKTLSAYLEKLLPIIDTVISKLLEEDNIVFHYLLFESAHNELLLQEEHLQKVRKMLDERWSDRDYCGFLKLYKEHKHIVSGDNLCRKRVAYAKKRVSLKGKRQAAVFTIKPQTK